MNSPYTVNRIAVFGTIRAFGLARSRLLLIKKLVSSGWQVIVATTLDNVYAPRLAEAGAVLEQVPFRRGGLSPFSDLQATIRLNTIFRTYQPQLIHMFHAKPIIFVGISARLHPQAKMICTVTGLGHVFIESSSLRALSVYGYRSAFDRSDAVIFQNPDDWQLFLDRHWVSPEKARLVVGSGVDTDRFVPQNHSEPSSNGALQILMVTRLLWQKGVREFVQAAEIVKEQRPNVRFLLAGEWDPVHPDAVEKSWVQEKVKQGVIDFLGYLNDMSKALQEADIFMLPSYYREGVPRVLMEAASCGVPVITTDAPGCREAVVHGETGLLVPPKNAQALAQAVLKLVDNLPLRQQMGQKGRELAKQRFDIRQITQEYINIYRELGLHIS